MNPDSMTATTYFSQAKAALKTNIIDVLSKPGKSGLQNKTVTRIELKVNNANPSAWLEQQSHTVKTFWADREGLFSMAGVGTAVEIKGQAQIIDYAGIFADIRKHFSGPDSNVRFYGGTRFLPEKFPEKLWQAFGNYRFIVPRFELITAGHDKTYLACNLTQTDSDLLSVILEELELLVYTPNNSFQNISAPVILTNQTTALSRKDMPDYKTWEANVTSILGLLKSQWLEKVVLARRTEFNLPKKTDPASMLNQLKRQNPGAYLFYLQPQPGKAFLGVTPERLYYRNRQYLESEAVASSRHRGKTPQEDIQLAYKLKTDAKDLQEHRSVSRMLKKRMRSLCVSTTTLADEQVLKLARIQHLRTRFSGTLKKGITDPELLTALHPNPAVAGYPTEDAIEKLCSIEDFDRGWYAGPIGWIGPDAAEFAVAIRSCLVHNRRLLLYGGAGIVPGSDPRMEWNEIENKISNFTKLLNINE